MQSHMAAPAEDIMSSWEGPESSCNANAMGPHTSAELILPSLACSFILLCILDPKE